jgi:2-dehydropantoate 2-reductase
VRTCAFVARGAHLEAMKRDGLTIENEPQGDIHVRQGARERRSRRARARGPRDHLGEAVGHRKRGRARIKPIVGPDTAVLSLQNGVIKDEILRA